MTEHAQTRCGFVAVIGAPNAGKSTLVNALVGAKVTIVSAKPQTTRSVVRGIVIHDGAQIILVDTPGIFRPQKRFERAMVAAAWNSESEADAVMVIVDASLKRVDRQTQEIFKRLADEKRAVPHILVLNKIDLIPAQALLEKAAEINAQLAFDATFMISALKGDGVNDILNKIAAHMPGGPWHFAEDEVSDLPARLMAAEITREKLFAALYQELPYGLTVRTEDWEVFDNGSIKISQAILVERDSQKGIVLGRRGAQIKSVGESARLELEEIFGMRIHLKLFVKVQEDWSEDPESYQEWGLDFKS